MLKNSCLFICLILCSVQALQAIGNEQYVKYVYSNNFCIVNNGSSASLVVDSADYAGVLRAAKDLQNDIKMVSNCLPQLTAHIDSATPYAIIIGTVGKNRLIDQLINNKKLNVDPIQNKWEAFSLQVIDSPTPDIQKALVIVGSDRRGTIYGMYDLSEQIGVSPWYWFADVSPQKHETLTVDNFFHKTDYPSVKYRGIFINDEAPALAGWMKHFTGGVFNSKFYTKVFELILRLKGNYLWPAMWGKSFCMDDPLNPQLADEYGIVMGTSHHEPMMRAQEEWKRTGSGAWSFETNRDTLLKFWAGGVARSKKYENIITIGMRGDGDEPMNTVNTLQENIQLMQQIVAAQEQLIATHVNPDVSKVPQLWALYKEVQEYYEHGMKVPDYVTLLWCDDNWGNIRRLPSKEERKRSGGAGIYYHVDYVGGPRCYKWINTVPVTKIWEQMSKASEYGADRIWIVNVGDIKGLELPLDFFLNLAWNPKRWNKDNLSEYTRQWAAQQFGEEYASDITDILSKYTKYNGRIKPELISPETFSLLHYREAETVISDWKSISDKADSIYKMISDDKKDAYYELVLYPVKASYTLNDLYVCTAKNRLYARQGRISTNDYAKKSKELFEQDSLLTLFYHKTVAGGKWKDVMGQPHIGYTRWNDPPHNIMPQQVQYTVNSTQSGKRLMGVVVEGDSIPVDGVLHNQLPQFSNYSREKHYFELFATQNVPVHFSLKTTKPWIILSATQGTAQPDRRIEVSINWDKLSKGKNIKGDITVAGGGKLYTIGVSVFNPQSPNRSAAAGFVESNGYISIEAEHFSVNKPVNGVQWVKVPDYGRTLSSMMPQPATAVSITDLSQSPYLEYKCYFFTTGEVTVHTLIAPTINCIPEASLRFAVAIDDEQPQTVEIPKISISGQNDNFAWSKSVIDNIRVKTTTHRIDKEGYHTIRIYMIDPIVVLQRIVIDTGGLQRSFLFPPESFHNR